MIEKMRKGQGKMEQKDVFISYKSEEFDEANWVKSILEHNGISCWMAPMSIPGGSSYAVEIPAAIRQCKVFVLILSEQTQLSKWVPRELDQAINQAKVIMPFMLEDCHLKDDFNFYLSNVQRYEAYKSKSRTIERMLREIQAILQKEEESPAEEIQPPIETEPEFSRVEPQRVVVKPKEEPEKKTKTRNKPGKKKLPLLLAIPAVILAAIVLLVLIGSGISKANKITIAGTVFEKDSYTLRLEGKTLTAADILNIAQFNDLSRVELKNCTLNTEDISGLVVHGPYSVILSNCGLTNQQLATLDLKGQPYLHELDISGNAALTDLGPLLGLEDRLEYLNISGVGIKDISVLRNFTKLEKLHIEDLALENLTALTEMIYLRELYANGNCFQTLEGMENTTLLSKVELGGNAISDVSLLANSKDHLTRLVLDGNPISDLSCLKDCTGLESVSVNDTQLESLKWLENSINLSKLSARNCKISSVEGLGNGNALKSLDLSGNTLTAVNHGELAFREGGYITLNLSGNSLTSCQIPGNCHYSILALQGNPLCDLSFLKEIKGSKVYFDYPADMEPLALEGIGFYQSYIINCPLDRMVQVEDVLTTVSFITADEVPAVFAD